MLSFVLLMFLMLIPIEFFPQETNNTSTTNNAELEQKQISKWENILNYGISSQRLAVVKQIRYDKSSNATAILEKQFTNDNSQLVKEEIIYTLIDMDFNNSSFWKSVIVQETNLVVLQRLAFAVEKLNITDAGTELYEALTNTISDPNAMRFDASAVRALGEIKFSVALPTIIDIATNQDNHQDLRGAAVVAVGAFQDSAQIPLLESILTNSLESKFIRRYAALAIGRTADPKAIDILTPIVLNEEEEQSVRINAIAGLGYTSNEDTIKTMEDLTKSDNTAIRTEAIKSLGRIKADSAKTILEFKAFQDPEAIVRREAKTALQNMGVDVDALEKERKQNQ